jgi:uncharacterized sporulation protein YeaH/YhbH (DUF444 family)
MHIVDRRRNPGSKSLENRQRFLRRAKARVQGAVKKSSQNNRPFVIQTDQTQRVLACVDANGAATTTSVFRDMAMCSSCF